MPADSQPPIGIDLGTTLSVIAYVDSKGQPKTIANAEGDLLTPSAVLFEHLNVTVGKEALKAAVMEPDGFADYAKRDMGESNYCREILGEQIPPEVIQSLVLQKLRHDAQAKLGPVKQVVVTVPAYFNEPRRKATQDAGRLAGLDILDIINEPTAAALAYGCLQGFLSADGKAILSERILIYDLGGGTFDVTLMEIEGDQFNTIATAGDVHLGGIDFDRRLVDHVAEQFMEKYAGVDPRKDIGSLQRMMREAEEVKRALANRQKTLFTFEYKGHGLRSTITRDQFESMIGDLVHRTIFTMKSVVKQSSLEWKDITRVLLVGGSTRLPIVQRLLQEEFDIPIDKTISTDEAVAHGAALYAKMLMSSKSGGKPKMSIVNVNSHNLGVLGTEIATGRPRSSVIIPNNTALPITRGKRFSTAKDGQRSIKVRVIEGGNSSGKNATLVGECVVRDLPRGLPAGTPVEVFFTYAQNGRLTVKARVPKLNKEAVLSVVRESGMSEEKITEWRKRLAQLTFSFKQ